MIKNYQHTEKLESFKYFVRKFSKSSDVNLAACGYVRSYYGSNDGMIVDGKSVNVETYMVEQTMKQTTTKKNGFMNIYTTSMMK